MNRYKLAHVTLFSYDGSVSESYNELRLRPRHDEAQSCLSFRLTTTPFSKPTSYLDYFNNWVHQFHILPDHEELRVESEAIVLVHPTPLYVNRVVPLHELEQCLESLKDEYFDWLAPSEYCPLLPTLREMSAEVEARCDSTVRGFAETAAALVHEQFTYKPGATHVHSSVQDCLSTRAGVCQDFAHLLIALLRLRGIPARYVSGYLVPRQSRINGEEAPRQTMENVIGGQASHAWVQANIPEIGWIGLDPTVGHFVDEQHIVVARGRDYGDVPPVRGVYKGHAGQSLSVDVLVRPALDDEGAELLQETAAGPSPPPEAEEQQQQQQQ
ncbi:MAG: transglutaminase family protein [Acidobacteriota bacterium]|nr:transglutaminase family protein [Acidobacteriota bacterium]